VTLEELERRPRGEARRRFGMKPFELMLAYQAVEFIEQQNRQERGAIKRRWRY